MNELQNFLNEFLTAEAEVSNKYRQPDLEAYNAAVDQIANYTSEELNLSFGAKLVQLRDANDYERVKNYPLSIPRHIFRIDQYLSR
ncbi:MAG: hypothetical protein MK212_12950 [Saprospiraceae bacterium]|nr:hypothetical protein [Saprospiraceae bacterium]